MGAGSRCPVNVPPEQRPLLRTWWFASLCVLTALSAAARDNPGSPDTSGVVRTHAVADTLRVADDSGQREPRSPAITRNLSEIRQDTLRTLRVTEGFTETEGWTSRKYIATAGVGFIMGSVLTDAYFTWWKDASAPFSFYRESFFSNSHLGLDRVGHMFGAYAISTGVRNLMMWGGFSPTTATWWGAGLSFLNSLTTEIGDGFTPFGFDWSDLAMGAAGIGYGLLQIEVPALRDINLKVSYWSGRGFKTPAAFIQDYDAMTVWVSVNVHAFLPESWQPYWPPWLAMAVGYGVHDGETRREFAIGFDINFVGFTGTDETMLFAKKSFNLLRPPLPAVKFSEGRKPHYQMIMLR